MGFLFNKLEMNKAERRTFSIHTIYMILEGIVLGVLALNQFVFIKSLNGTNYQLGFLFQFSALVFLFLIVINEFLKRSYKQNVNGIFKHDREVVHSACELREFVKRIKAKNFRILFCCYFSFDLSMIINELTLMPKI